MTQPTRDTPHPLEIRLQNMPYTQLTRMITADVETPTIELPESRKPDTSQGLLAICTTCGTRMRTETGTRQEMEYQRIPAHECPDGQPCPAQLTTAGCLLCPGCETNIVGYLPGDKVSVLLCGQCRQAAARTLTPLEEAELARMGTNYLYRQPDASQ